MKYVSYNEEIRSATGQLLDAFDNIKIKRTIISDNGTSFIKEIAVPCVYGPRSRVIKALENRNATLKPPITAISMTGLSRDQRRVHSNNRILDFKTGDNVNLDHNIATPITISYQLEIICKYMKDFEQILDNFIAIMNPDIYIAWQSPAGNVKSQVIWQGDISINNAENVDKRSPYRISGTTNFIIKTWIFPGTGPYAEDGKRIKSINYNNYETEEDISNENVFSRWYDNTSYTASMDDFYDMIKDGLITSPNYDTMKIVDTLSGSQWLDSLHGIISSTVYDFRVSGDLIHLINNASDPDLLITNITVDGIHFSPENFNDGTIDWGDIWSRMLSGDLSYNTLSGSEIEYNYLLDENGAFLLYENERLIPLWDFGN